MGVNQQIKTALRGNTNQESWWSKGIRISVSVQGPVRGISHDHRYDVLLLPCAQSNLILIGIALRAHIPDRVYQTWDPDYIPPKFESSDDEISLPQKRTHQVRQQDGALFLL